MVAADAPPARPSADVSLCTLHRAAGRVRILLVEITPERSIRPHLKGAVGSGVLLCGSLAWLILQRPPLDGQMLAWFALLALLGCLLPGIANQFTVARAYLAGPALAYALSPSGLGGLAVVVAVAAGTDLVDGRIARRLEGPTRLGGALDPVVDGIFFGAAAVGLAMGGAYPWWLGLVVVLRYLVPAVVGLVMVLLARPVHLTHTPLGQASTALIAIVLGGIALFRGLGVSDSWLEAFGMVAVPASTLATWANLYWANRRAFWRWRSG